MDLKLVPLESDKKPEGKAKFGERTPKGKYTGVEHRHFVRRVLADRRAAVRFEPDKKDRRSGLDRRTDGRWSNAYSL